MKDVTISCTCSCSMVKISKDEEDYFISFYLNYYFPKKSFFRRLKDFAQKELFKKQNSDLGIVCKQEDIDRLKQFLGENPLKNSLSANSSTGYKGIYFDNRSNRKTSKYVAQIAVRLDGESIQKIHIGSYDTLQEAVKARENYILNLF